jgi:Uma2 family endonuclease
MGKVKTKSYEIPPSTSDEVKEPAVAYKTSSVSEVMRYTYADYLTWIDDIRRELINGIIHLVSGPMRRHASVSDKIDFQIRKFIEKKKGKCEVYHAPFDVRLPLYGSNDDDKIFDVVQPDICVICDLSKLDDRGCIGAPDLIVEVLSPSTMRMDWNRKFGLYEKAGVREYWIVDPKGKTANVFILQPDGTYDIGTVYDDTQKAPVHIFEGLEINLKKLFKEK